jgi:hypothetical protein
MFPTPRDLFFNRPKSTAGQASRGTRRSALNTMGNPEEDISDIQLVEGVDEAVEVVR